jgi:Mrp family chromosome partitioning ATPase
MRERYVLLGLARARTEWFSRVGRWATAASIPAEFVRCISVQELRARLRSGRQFSAALLDGASPGVDRDLLAALHDAGTAAIVVDDATGRPWDEVGADAVLPPDHDREQLLEVLAARARMVGPAVVGDEPEVAEPGEQRSGALVAVTGPGGTGASVAAIALAQGLAAADRGSVLLADCCRVADQAMLHDSRVVVPSVQEVVEAHRAGSPTTRDVRDQTFEVVERGYRLLLGLRRPRQWVTLRPQAVESTLDSLLRTFDLVVADIEPDLEGEEETGSVDVEDRHLLARAAASRATAVVVVGAPGMKGLHALVRTILELLSFGVPGRRIVPVVNQAPRSPRERAELSTSLGSLARASLGASGTALPSPVFLPRRKVDTALRDGVAVPRPLPDLLVSAVGHVLDRVGTATSNSSAMPRRVTPGSMKLFTSSREGAS